MISEITIGQYFPGNSYIHKLDARIKLILSFLNIVIIFVCKNFFSLGLMLGFAVFSILISRVSLKTVLKGMRMIFFVIIFSSILQVMYNDEGKTLVEWKFIHITDGGVYTAIFIIIRIISLILLSSLLTYTTSPTLLTDAIERVFSPLKVFKINVHTLAMMMTIALRFIPTLIEEIEKIMSAQKARGANLETGGIIARSKALVPIFVPLFVNSFRRAYELALAMECRCYRGAQGRTRMRQMHLQLRDYLAILISFAIIGGIITFNILIPPVI